MRLVCPNCQAEYDVDDGAIPPAGRDVQCSACGHIWLQAPAGGWPEPETGEHPDEPPAPEARDTPDAGPTGQALHDDAEPSEGAEATAAEPEAEPEAKPETEAEPEPEREAQSESQPEHETEPAAEPEAEPAPDLPPEPETALDPSTEARPDTESDLEPEDILLREAEADEAAEPETPGASETPPRRATADPVALAILREEAEREAAARARERTGAPLEYQAELGLDSSQPAEPPVEEALAPAPRPTRPAKRGRDRLPDIEEINTTLRPEAGNPRQRPASGRDGTQSPSSRPTSRLAHRAGLLLVIAGFAAATLVYARPEIITDALPGAAPRIEAYIAWVDTLRVRLDTGLRRSVVAIVALIEQLRG